MTANPIIDVQELSYTYPEASAPAVDDISFQINRGEIFGFLGPSGAGKSTTQRILIGLLRDYQGRAAAFGRDLHAWNHDYYERVGVSFEFPNHYLKLTALENLAYFQALYTGETEDPRRLLEQVGLDGEGDKRVSQYSKGMRVRLNVARALLHRPELLFLDEPTAGLDPGTSRRIQQLIQEQQEAGATVFLTTHDMHVAEALCDRVAFIVDGRLAVIDTPRTLRLRHGRRTVRVEYEDDGRSAHRDFPIEGLADNAAFLQTLRHESIQTIHTQETTLEEVFIEVTGRALT